MKCQGQTNMNVIHRQRSNNCEG